MRTVREKMGNIEATHRRELIRDRVAMVTLVCEELNRRNRPVGPEEAAHFNRLVLRAVDHVIQLL